MFITPTPLNLSFGIKGLNISAKLRNSENELIGIDKSKSAKIKIRPSGEDLDNYDKALDLGLKLPKADREIIWVIAISLADQAHGTWKRTAKRYNVTRQTMYNRHRGALIKACLIQKAV